MIKWGRGFFDTKVKSFLVDGRIKVVRFGRFSDFSKKIIVPILIHDTENKIVSNSSCSTSSSSIANAQRGDPNLFAEEIHLI